MFDMDKLNDMSKNLIGYMTAENVYSELISWANNYDVEFAKLLDANKEKMLAMLSVDRGGPKVRKDIIKMSDVKNVFYVKNADKIKNKNVLIFDDIYTTGATASECKKVLMEAGAKKCGIMTIARDFMK